MNPSQQIDKQIADLPDWRGDLFTKIRKIIHDADPEIVEEWKWDTAIFTHKKMVCAVAGFKDHVKINFFQCAVLSDPHKLFNCGLEAKKTRAIDFFEKDIINEVALKDLLQSAVEFNKQN